MHAINLYNAYIYRTVAVLIAVIAVSMGLYVALLFGAAMHASGRSDAESEVRALSQQVGELEGRYLAETQSLSFEKAKALGYVVPTEEVTVFASKNTNLTLR